MRPQVFLLVSLLIVLPLVSAQTTSLQTRVIDIDFQDAKQTQDGLEVTQSIIVEVWNPSQETVSETSSNSCTFELKLNASLQVEGTVSLQDQVCSQVITTFSYEPGLHQMNSTMTLQYDNVTEDQLIQGFAPGEYVISADLTGVDNETPHNTSITVEAGSIDKNYPSIDNWGDTSLGNIPVATTLIALSAVMAIRRYRKQ